MDTSNDDAIATFIAFTGADNQMAAQFLQMANNDVEMAASLFFAAAEGGPAPGEDDPMDGGGESQGEDDGSDYDDALPAMPAADEPPPPVPMPHKRQKVELRPGPTLPNASAALLATLQQTFALKTKPADAGDALHKTINERYKSWAHDTDDRGLAYLCQCWLRRRRRRGGGRRVHAERRGGRRRRGRLPDGVRPPPRARCCSAAKPPTTAFPLRGGRRRIGARAPPHRRRRRLRLPLRRQRQHDRRRGRPGQRAQRRDAADDAAGRRCRPRRRRAGARVVDIKEWRAAYREAEGLLGLEAKAGGEPPRSRGLGARAASRGPPRCNAELLPAAPASSATPASSVSAKPTVHHEDDATIGQTQREISELRARQRGLFTAALLKDKGEEGNKKAALSWAAATLAANLAPPSQLKETDHASLKRTKEILRKRASDGSLTNLGAVVLALCEPFAGGDEKAAKAHANFSRLDARWFAREALKAAGNKKAAAEPSCRDVERVAAASGEANTKAQKTAAKAFGVDDEEEAEAEAAEPLGARTCPNCRRAAGGGGGGRGGGGGGAYHPGRLPLRHWCYSSACAPSTRDPSGDGHARRTDARAHLEAQGAVVQGVRPRRARSRAPAAHRRRLRPDQHRHRSVPRCRRGRAAVRARRTIRHPRRRVAHTPRRDAAAGGARRAAAAEPHGPHGRRCRPRRRDGKRRRPHRRGGVRAAAGVRRDLGSLLENLVRRTGRRCRPPRPRLRRSSRAPCALPAAATSSPRRCAAQALRCLHAFVQIDEHKAKVRGGGGGGFFGGGNLFDLVDGDTACEVQLAIMSLYTELGLHTNTTVGGSDKNGQRMGLMKVLRKIWDMPAAWGRCLQLAAASAECGHRRRHRGLRRLRRDAGERAHLPLDDALGRLADLKAVQDEMADEETWAKQPEKTRKEREHAAAGLQRTAKGFLSLAKASPTRCSPSRATARRARRSRRWRRAPRWRRCCTSSSTRCAGRRCRRSR